MKYILLIYITLQFTSCSLCYTNMCEPQQDFIISRNNQIGLKFIKEIKPYQYKNAGKMFRTDSVKASIGVTHITSDKNGNIIMHWHGQEILPTYHDKSMIGKCLTYQVIHPNTKEILSWGFDKGGNPKSCVAWWP